MSEWFHSGDHGLLFDNQGQRKYLCREESRLYVKAANRSGPANRLFCLLLHYTGCRISEALEVTPRHLDISGRRVVFRTLKRRKLVFRAVPLPATFMLELVAFATSHAVDARLWPWCRQTAWRHVKKVMADAGIKGPQAVPRGLRHQFGVRAMQAHVPLTLTQRLLGHASPATTAIYQHATGDDERRLLLHMWRQESSLSQK